MARQLALRILIEGAPAGIDYALQKGRGNAYETVQRQRSSGQVLIFEFRPVIRDAAEKGGAALGGRFVQGRPDMGSCISALAHTPVKPIRAGAGCPKSRSTL